MNEFDYIAWLRQRTPISTRIPVGPGDDCAVVGQWLVTTDMLLEGSHFILAEVGARRVGRKAMAVNLSDIAAMGGKPIAAFVSVGLPRGISPLSPWGRGAGGEGAAPLEGIVSIAGNASDASPACGAAPSPPDPLPRRGERSIQDPPSPSNALLHSVIAEELYHGMRDVADAFDTAIAGGDTNAWNGELVVSVTLIGEPGPQGPILRRGAKPGDWLLVTGPLGGSILGKHLDFTPRVREALLLQDHARLHAMIDISDGLAADAFHLCEESGCGLVLLADKIPISEAACRMVDAKSPLEHALSDGEDFELAFAVDPGDGARLIKTQPIPGITVSHVGEFIGECALFVDDRRMEPRGFAHEFV